MRSYWPRPCAGWASRCRSANDLKREQLIAGAASSFRDLADKSDWAVVYFAGHGVEVDRANYLVPVDARLKSDRDVQDEAVAAGSRAGGRRGRQEDAADHPGRLPRQSVSSYHDALDWHAVGRAAGSPVWSRGGARSSRMRRSDGQVALERDGRQQPVRIGAVPSHRVARVWRSASCSGWCATTCWRCDRQPAGAIHVWLATERSVLFPPVTPPEFF